jgi:hypothetical protein
MDIKNIYWIAGILEGEGCFNYYNAPRIFLKMTDKDTVERARNITGADAVVREQDRIGLKRSYILAINSHYAVGWMMTLYSIMSARRKEQIKQVLSEWRNAKAHNGFTIATGEALITAIARKYMVPRHKAKIMVRSGRFPTGADGRTYIGFRKQ